jgi:peptide/nickel transport system substrate-binding protein
MNRLKGMLLTMLLVALACSLIQCAAPTATPESPAEATATSVAPTATPIPPTPTPARPLVIAQGAEALTLDPHIPADMTSHRIFQNIFDTLVFRDRDMKLQPHLATSYELLDDTTWQFKLREGVLFHNGEPFDANSVKFSVERILNPDLESHMAGWFATIDHVEIVDDYTVNIITGAPDPLLPGRLTWLYMVPPQYVQENGDEYFGLHPVGTGPYTFVEWVKDDHLSLQANEEYWNGAPAIQEVVFRPIPETSTRIAALLTGEADIIDSVPSDQVGTIENSDVAKVASVLSKRQIYIGLDNINDTPLKDKRVRLAINYAVDVPSLIENIMGGYAIQSASPVLPMYFGYDPDIKPFPYDPEKAKDLLAEAGYPDGFQVTLDTSSGRYVMDKETAEAVAGQLAEVGIDAQVEVLEWGVYVSKFLEYPKGVAPMYLIGWGAAFLDADQPLYDALHTGEILGRYSNADFDQLIEAARVEMDPDKRYELYQEAQQILKDDPPWLFLWQLKDIYGVSKDVVWEPRTDEFISLLEVSFAE